MTLVWLILLHRSSADIAASTKDVLQVQHAQMDARPC